MTGASTPSALADAVRAAVAVAVRAPSLHNSQPWRWQTTSTGVRLRLDESRLLPATDPDGHGAVVSCGASWALAELALRAGGYYVRSDAHPRVLSDVLAELTVLEGPSTPDSVAARLVEAAAARFSDRRALDGTSVDEAFLADLRRQVEPGTALHVIAEDAVFRLAALTEAAEARERLDPAYRAELAAWTLPSGRSGEQGVPVMTRSADRRTTVPQRDFDVADTDTGRWYDGEVTGETLDRPAFVVVLTEGDAVLDWLRAGRLAMSVMLAATERGWSSCALSQSVDHAADRVRLRQALDTVVYPQLVIRIGLPAGGDPTTERAGRRPVADVID